MIRDVQHLDRRRFLQVSGAAAACGLATSTSATASDTKLLIDTHVYIGHWPLRQLSADTTTKLVDLLRREGVTQAWAGNFNGLFHKDVHGANLRLVGACRNVGDGFLIPIGTVNPTLPGWEEDVRRCHETFKMQGIRLHPTYHGYTLNDPRFARLLELAAGRRLLVQIVAHLTAKRQRHLTPPLPRVDLAPLAQMPRIRNLRLLIAGAMPTEAPPGNTLPNGLSAHFDFAGASDGEALLRLMNSAAADRIVYGSAAPLSDVKSRRDLLQQVKLTAAQVDGICSGNAQRLTR